MPAVQRELVAARSVRQQQPFMVPQLVYTLYSRVTRVDGGHWGRVASTVHRASAGIAGVPMENPSTLHELVFA